MDSRQASTLLRLGHPRFRSFSEAADSCLLALCDAIPGMIVLGRIEPGEEGCRVIDARGAGLEGLSAGTVLPLASSVPGARSGQGGDRASSPDGELLDQEFLRQLGMRDFLEIPLEVSDGRIVGALAAIAPDADAYGIEQTALLTIAARLLGHQWENVELLAELRRLRRLAALGTDVDAETGLPDRTGFLGLLNHEWRLANRGTVESVLLTFGVGTARDGARNGDAIGRLALRTVAEVLEGNVRETDRVGRVGPASLATVLVGCRLDQAPAFVGRFQEALRRVTEGHEPQIELSLGVQVLAGGPSAERVLELAEAAADTSAEPDLAPVIPAEPGR